MELKLNRIRSNKEETLGELFTDGAFECYTLEDQYQEKKVYAETRIPAGRYEIKLQHQGTMTKKYEKRFPQIHRGMLWLQDVPNFTTIYIHIGNTDDDTKGCILVGLNHSEENGRMKLVNSTQAYIHLYVKCLNAIDREEKIYITITDNDIKKEN